LKEENKLRTLKSKETCVQELCSQKYYNRQNSALVIIDYKHSFFSVPCNILEEMEIALPYY